jgi:hypothetical protein
MLDRRDFLRTVSGGLVAAGIASKLPARPDAPPTQVAAGVPYPEVYRSKSGILGWMGCNPTIGLLYEHAQLSRVPVDSLPAVREWELTIGKLVGPDALLSAFYKRFGDTTERLPLYLCDSTSPSEWLIVFGLLTCMSCRVAAGDMGVMGHLHFRNGFVGPICYDSAGDCYKLPSAAWH